MSLDVAQYLIKIKIKDGTLEEAIPSTELFPIHHLDELEFFPGDFVIPSEQTSQNTHCYGVVESVNHRERTCMVRWMTAYDVGQETRPEENAKSEEVSVYDIKDHSDYKFRPGHVVVRVGGYEEGDDVSRHQVAGQVFELGSTGHMLIRWVDGSQSRCYPQELFLIGDDEMSELESDGETEEESDSEESGSDSGASDASWETEEEEEVASDTPSEIITSTAADDMLPSVRGAIEQLLQDAGPACASDVCLELLRLHRVAPSMIRLPAAQSVLTFLRSAAKTLRAVDIGRRVAHRHVSVTTTVNDADDDDESNGDVVALMRNLLEGGGGVVTGSSEDVGEGVNEAMLEVSLATDSLAVEQAVKQVCVALCNQWLAHLDTVPTSAIDTAATEDNSPPTTLALDSVAAPRSPASSKPPTPVTPKAASGATPRTPAVPQTPQTPAEIRAKIEYNVDGFSTEDCVPTGHRYRLCEQVTMTQKSFLNALTKELKLLHTSLPKGIYVKGFDDRMDLFSVMVCGPAKTPYEDGLFFFDVRLPAAYPSSPPDFHYHAYCTDRLNPNLYDDGKVCVSLLGTWAGKGTEMWTSNSSLLQVLISIQGLILVSEPYYNEAGYEKQRGSQLAEENSRMYNEMAILKMVQSMCKIAHNPPTVFETHVREFLKNHAPRMIRRLEAWTRDGDTSGGGDEQSPADSSSSSPPAFPLLPLSRGFRLTLQKNLDQFKSLTADLLVSE